MRDEALPDETVQVAVVGRPHGVRGEVRLIPESEDPGRLARLKRSWLVLADGRVVAAPVATMRAHGDVALARFEGIEDRDVAEELVHARMWALRKDLPKWGADAFGVDEVVGLELWDGDARAGTITGVASNGGRDFFEVDVDGRSVLVPAVKDWLVAREAGRIVMTLPAGLLDP